MEWKLFEIAQGFFDLLATNDRRFGHIRQQQGVIAQLIETPRQAVANVDDQIECFVREQWRALGSRPGQPVQDVGAAFVEIECAGVDERRDAFVEGAQFGLDEAVFQRGKSGQHQSQVRLPPFPGVDPCAEFAQLGRVQVVRLVDNQHGPPFAAGQAFEGRAQFEPALVFVEACVAFAKFVQHPWSSARRCGDAGRRQEDHREPGDEFRGQFLQQQRFAQSGGGNDQADPCPASTERRN